MWLTHQELKKPQIELPPPAGSGLGLASRHTQSMSDIPGRISSQRTLLVNRSNAFCAGCRRIFRLIGSGARAGAAEEVVLLRGFEKKRAILC